MTRADVAQPEDRADRLSGASATTRRRRSKPQLASMDEVDPEVRKTFEKLGIPLEEQKLLAGVAVDAVFDSVSVATTFRAKLGELGIIFCSFSEAVKDHPELVKKYLGSVVPYTDNFFATLNSAVFSDGSFVYIPKGVQCPMELSTYFRINAKNTGQFERTLIIADEGSHGELPRRLHGADARRAPAARGGRRAGRARQRDDQVLDDPELVPGRQGRQGRHLQLRHQARQGDDATRRSRGRRSRPARRSPGSIRAASCRATTRSASSTRWRRPTTGSRPTPARR